jgi:hypothetical protein
MENRYLRTPELETIPVSEDPYGGEPGEDQAEEEDWQGVARHLPPVPAEEPLQASYHLLTVDDNFINASLGCLSGHHLIVYVNPGVSYFIKILLF